MLRLAAVALVLGLLACTAPVGPTPPGQPPPPTQTPIIPTVTMLISTVTPASTFDRQFIDAIVPLNEATVQMAQIALERSQRPDVQALAQDVITTRSAEIEDLRAWREAWFSSRATPDMSRAPVLLEPGAPVAVGTVLTLDLAAEVEALRNAPEPFDAAFVEAMLRSQPRATEAALLAIRRARQQEILDLSGAMLETHQRWARQLDDLR
jgi:uncharacterized protein (DUF305 family)